MMLGDCGAAMPLTDMRTVRICRAMQVVVETWAYLAAAKRAGIDENERSAIVDLVAANPDGGEIIPGSGGCRKIRVAGKGKGKSGGYRLITYYVTENAPVLLLTIFAKSDSANLTPSQVNELAGIVKPQAKGTSR
jgi:mRNA-degrading endonuclease RelE of RelBE toxin-antitoxin system